MSTESMPKQWSLHKCWNIVLLFVYQWLFGTTLRSSFVFFRRSLISFHILFDMFKVMFAYRILVSTRVNAVAPLQAALLVTVYNHFLDNAVKIVRSVRSEEGERTFDLLYRNRSMRQCTVPQWSHLSTLQRQSVPMHLPFGLRWSRLFDWSVVLRVDKGHSLSHPRFQS